MSNKCPCCGKFFLSEKKVMRHLRDTQRERARKLNGLTIVKQIGQAQLHDKTLMPKHESNSKEQRIKQGKTRWSTWSLQ